MSRCVFLMLACVLVTHAEPSHTREPTTDTGIGVFYLPGAPGETNLWREGDEGSRL